MEADRGGPWGGSHTPVLLHQVVALLQPRSDAIVVDGTLGLGGHSAALANVLGPGGLLLGVDRDASALKRAEARLKGGAVPCRFFHASFSAIPQLLVEVGVGEVDAVLLDIGVSSLQLETPERGFSFRHGGPLDMRMDPSSPGPTAQDLVMQLPEDELADMLWRYGEERFSRRIAKRLVAARAEGTIATTEDLARLVRRAVPGRSRIDKATRTFQALRIAVNDELGELERALETVPEVLAPGGRLAVISFHSLEDRLVKQRFRDWAEDDVFRLVTRKPVRPETEEAAANPRSRSARLRVLERTA